MTRRILKNKKGFSLVELLVAIAIFSIVYSSVAFFAADAVRFTQNNRMRIQASLSMQEMANAVMLNKNDLWSSIVSNTANGSKTINFTNNVYQLSSGTTSTNGITTSLTIDYAYRNATGDFVSSGGTQDQHSRKVNLTATWTDLLGRTNNYIMFFYLNDWNTLQWEQDTAADFNNGTRTNTVVNTEAGGEVELDTVLLSDWCKPELTLSNYDLPGSGTPTLISSVAGKAYIGSSSSTATLQGITINHATTPSTVSVNGTFNGYSTNSIFGDSQYAYLATTNDSKEIVIIDTTKTPYQEVGYFNASGNTDAKSVYVVGNVGYMLQGTMLRTFDLSSKTGSRSQLDSLTVATSPIPGGGDYASEVQVVGNYAYVSLYNDYHEMNIVSVANPSNITMQGYADMNSQQSYDLFVNSSGTRVYMGTTNSSSQREFFIIDTTSKTGSRPVIASYDSNGTSVRGVTVIDNRAILVGTGGQEYQVLNLTQENNISLCGGLQANNGLMGVTSNITASEERYSYVIENSPNSEFRVIKGGATNGNGTAYIATGNYTSQVLDTASTTASYYSLEWTGAIPIGATMKIQVRSSTTSNMSGATWVGPDGTSATYFTNPLVTPLPTNLNNKRYFQYKVDYTSDGSATGTLNKIKLTYQK